MKELTLNIPHYSTKHGAVSNWEDGFVIKSDVVKDQIIIAANQAGLISLAKHLLFLAQDETPLDCHYHLDEHNSLEIGSKEIIICKI
ncbi:MAG: hypothetical protein J7577_14705 [Sphingobacteriaceae bacterium]|nr:hypothetical protein [Sphingobacteriaceae bacterium]